VADAGHKTFSYLYDFGDGWSHTVELEKLAPTLQGEPILRLLEAVGRCPPEDCGGPFGYERLLKILADPDDAEHDELLAWCGGPIDPNHADVPALEAAANRLARRWSPRSRAAPKQLS
jgi:Plasmid pRiA4b ORF-3-like protein